MQGVCGRAPAAWQDQHSASEAFAFVVILRHRADKVDAHPPQAVSWRRRTLIAHTRSPLGCQAGPLRSQLCHHCYSPRSGSRRPRWLLRSCWCPGGCRPRQSPGRPSPQQLRGRRSAASSAGAGLLSSHLEAEQNELSERGLYTWQPDQTQPG